MFSPRAKKLGILLGTMVAVNALAISAGHAADAGGGTSPELAVLQQIEKNTVDTLQAVNNIPTYLNALKLGEFITSWLNPDDSDPTSQLQGHFAKIGLIFNENLTKQNQLQQNINNVLFADPATKKPLTAAQIPNLASLTYSSLLTPSSDPTSQFNYILNAGGINLPHAVPSNAWGGDPKSIATYTNYYNTIMAAESFGGYVLSNQYADGNQFNEQQQALITQVTNADQWASKIASESLGIVLKQILLFESQSYVLITQLVQTQKQMVTAQTMTNALLIAVNQGNEMMLIQSAKGTVPVS